MKTKLTSFLTLLLALVMQISFAQDRTISGTVSDKSGPLPGVNILKKGTKIGIDTNFDGKYTIKAKDGDVLIFSYVGMVTIEKTVGASNIVNSTMVEDTNILNEVVVTAQGIAREKKTLGFAVTTIKAGLIERKPETDIAKILNGKVAGVQINNTGGFLGTQTNVIIRSKNSISGNNQPLYIIDGAPIHGERSYDLDQNNVENVSVLRGLAASTLYGEEGRNGVIIITTKTGSGKNTAKKFEISFSSTTSFLEIGNFPDFQNTYGQGFDNVLNTTLRSSYGAKFAGQIVPHVFNRPNFATIFPQFQGKTVEYKAIPNNVTDFFSTGLGTNTSLIARKGGENSSFSIAVNHSEQTGYIPENKLRKFSINLGGTAKLANNFKLNSTMNYYNTNNRAPSRNLFDLLTLIPRNLDIHNLPFENPNDRSSVYYKEGLTNPRWIIKNTGNSVESNRIFAKVEIDYSFLEKFNVSYLYSLDFSNQFNQVYQNKGATAGDLGSLITSSSKNQVNSHRLNFSGEQLNIAKNVSLNGILGLEIKRNQGNSIGVTSTDQIVFGFLKHNNYKAYRPIEDESERNIIGVYGSFDFGYKDYVYLTLSARNDWASTVETNNNSIFYPSISASFMPTSAFKNILGKGNYLKVRASYGSSANFPRPYSTRFVLEAESNAYLNALTGNLFNTNSATSFKPNPNLKPELLKEYEIGLEGEFLKKRLSFDISVYKKIVNDQLLTSSLPNSTGFSTTIINAGRLDTKGLEIGLVATPFKSEDPRGFTWEINTNFTAYESTIINLPVERINISSNLNYAIAGEPYGVFRGTYNLRDDDGNLLINANDGKVLASDKISSVPDKKLLGDPNEDWTLNSINSFSYKGFTLSAQLEYTHGGDLYSKTAETFYKTGVTKDTENREGSYIIPGVLANSEGKIIRDANGQKIPNNIQIGASELGLFNLLEVAENRIFDASTLRLRDVSLSYVMPQKMLENTPFGSVIFTASGNNLWFYTPNLPKHMNIDPQTLGSGVGNGKGIDFQADPSYKQYSLGVKLTF